MKAGELLIETLATAPPEVTVRLTIRGFGNKVRQGNSFDVRSQRSAALDAFRDVASRTDDDNTDYVLALLAAAEHFKSVPGDNPLCRTMVWFTDGAYDIDDASVADIASYTSSTVDEDIEREFEQRVCGNAASGNPVTLGPSPLTGPVVELVNESNFTVRFIDLFAEGQSDRRTATEKVLRRLFPAAGGVDTCAIRGSWKQVSDTGQLAREFFASVQTAVGRAPVTPCTLVEDGIPISAVESIAAIASDPEATVTIYGPQGALEAAKSQVFRDLTSDDRLSAGLLTVGVSRGDVAECFVRTNVEVVLAGDDVPTVFEKATSVEVGVIVRGAGLVGQTAQPLDRTMFSLDELLVNGEAVAPSALRYDAATREYRVLIPGPFDPAGVISIGARATFTPTNEPVAPLERSIEVVAEPPAPRLTWVGEVLREGPGSIEGKIVVQPGIEAEGELCVSFDRPSNDIITADGQKIGTFEVDDGETCRKLSERFEIPGTAIFPTKMNAIGRADVGFSAQYTLEGEAEKPPATSGKVEGVSKFEEVKPASNAVGALFALVLAGLVALLSYLALFVAARIQNKLERPRDWIVARADVSREERTGSPDGIAFVGAGQFEIGQIDSLAGTRRLYDLGVVSVRSVWPWNPLARLHGVARVADGVVVAYPGGSRRRSASNSVSVPVRFRRLTLTNVRAEGIRMTLVMPRSSARDDFEQAMNEALRNRHSELVAACTAVGLSPKRGDGGPTDAGVVAPPDLPPVPPGPPPPPDRGKGKSFPTLTPPGS